MIVKSLFVEYYRTEVLHQRNDIIRLQTSAYGRALAGIQLIKQKKPYFRNCSLSLSLSVGRFRSRSLVSSIFCIGTLCTVLMCLPFSHVIINVQMHFNPPARLKFNTLVIGTTTCVLRVNSVPVRCVRVCVAIRLNTMFIGCCTRLWLCVCVA